MGHPTRTALGLAGGYLLGRYHKAGWLVMAAVAVAASKRLGESLAGSSSPELKKLVDQGRETATALMGNQVQGLTSRLQATTESLRQPVQEKEKDGSEQKQQEQQQAGGEQEQGQQGQGEQEQKGQEQGGQEQGDQRQAGGGEQASGEQQASGEPETDRGQDGEPKEQQSRDTSRDRRSQVSGRPATSAAARRRR